MNIEESIQDSGARIAKDRLKKNFNSVSKELKDSVNDRNEKKSLIRKINKDYKTQGRERREQDRKNRKAEEYKATVAEVVSRMERSPGKTSSVTDRKEESRNLRKESRNLRKHDRKNRKD